MNFMLEIPRGNVKPFEMKVLASGLCDFTIPMSFSFCNEKQELWYDCGGYTPVRELEIKDSAEFIRILEKTFVALNKSGEFLIDPAKMTLSTETVFYNRRTGEVRIAYVPIERGNRSLKENIYVFLQEAEDMAPAAVRIYLREIKKYVRTENCKISDIVNVLGEASRDIYYQRSGNSQQSTV